MHWWYYLLQPKYRYTIPESPSLCTVLYTPKYSTNIDTIDKSGNKFNQEEIMAVK